MGLGKGGRAGRVVDASSVAVVVLFPPLMDPPTKRARRTPGEGLENLLLALPDEILKEEVFKQLLANGDATDILNLLATSTALRARVISVLGVANARDIFHRTMVQRYGAQVDEYAYHETRSLGPRLLAIGEWLAENIPIRLAQNQQAPATRKAVRLAILQRDTQGTGFMDSFWLLYSAWCSELLAIAGTAALHEALGWINRYRHEGPIISGILFEHEGKAEPTWETKLRVVHPIRLHTDAAIMDVTKEGDARISFAVAAARGRVTVVEGDGSEPRGAPVATLVTTFREGMFRGGDYVAIVAPRVIQWNSNSARITLKTRTLVGLTRIGRALRTDDSIDVVREKMGRAEHLFNDADPRLIAVADHEAVERRTYRWAEQEYYGREPRRVFFEDTYRVRMEREAGKQDEYTLTVECSTRILRIVLELPALHYDTDFRNALLPNTYSGIYLEPETVQRMPTELRERALLYERYRTTMITHTDTAILVAPDQALDPMLAAFRLVHAVWELGWPEVPRPTRAEDAVPPFTEDELTAREVHYQVRLVNYRQEIADLRASNRFAGVVDMALFALLAPDKRGAGTVLQAGRRAVAVDYRLPVACALCASSAVAYVHAETRAGYCAPCAEGEED